MLLTWPAIRAIWMAVRRMGLSVMFTFFITLSLFPGITASLVSYSQPDSKLFVPIVCFLLFNLGDWVGRTLAGWRQILSARTLPYAIAARVVFLPLFLLCNLKGTQLPVVFTSDAAPIVFMLAFSISNGYFASLAMMQGPQCVEEHQRETAGSLMVLLLVGGLLLGSITSFGWKSLVTRSSPFG